MVEPISIKNLIYFHKLHIIGQVKLENAKVCLINGTATGSEILKNLVLPGIGSFTIVDEATVKESDLGNNFFVSADYLGSSRAKCVTELLIEMNEDVRGSHVEEVIVIIIKIYYLM